MLHTGFYKGLSIKSVFDNYRQPVEAIVMTLPSLTNLKLTDDQAEIGSALYADAARFAYHASQGHTKEGRQQLQWELYDIMPPTTEDSEDSEESEESEPGFTRSKRANASRRFRTARGAVARAFAKSQTGRRRGDKREMKVSPAETLTERATVSAEEEEEQGEVRSDDSGTSSAVLVATSASSDAASASASDEERARSSSASSST